MNEKFIMIRFGELSTKGKNKKDFIAILARNIKHSLKEYNLEYIVRHDHIYISNLTDENFDNVCDILKDISGIHSFSIVYKIPQELNDIVEFCSEFVKIKSGKTFKIVCKRSDKSYPHRSEEIIRAVATSILKNENLKVDVHNPDIKLNIEVRQDGVFVFFDTFLGAGGYPLGVAGKALMMLSGGIDSPVAAYLLMKRGISLEFIHFASPPYTQDGVIDKLTDILKILNKYQASIKLHIVPFTKIQEEIYKNSDESYAITIMRRQMYKIASIYASYHKLLAVCNGESIGQVASQTLNSIKVIDDQCRLPVIRPLAIFDKLEIISIAEKIGTFNISIRHFEDCCTIFKPKNPKTSPNILKVEEYEAKVDYALLVSEALENIRTIVIKEEEFSV
ncbi:MAG: tRNA uracil 4-sulfurtransferase ThiI [Bacilli bacterium]